DPDHVELTVVRLDGSFQHTFHSDWNAVKPFKDGLAVYNSGLDPFNPAGPLLPERVDMFNFAKGISWQVVSYAWDIFPSPDGTALLLNRADGLFLQREGHFLQRVSDSIYMANWLPDGSRFFVSRIGTMGTSLIGFYTSEGMLQGQYHLEGFPNYGK